MTDGWVRWDMLKNDIAYLYRNYKVDGVFVKKIGSHKYLAASQCSPYTLVRVAKMVDGEVA